MQRERRLHRRCRWPLRDDSSRPTVPRAHRLLPVRRRPVRLRRRLPAGGGRATSLRAGQRRTRSPLRPMAAAATVTRVRALLFVTLVTACGNDADNRTPITSGGSAGVADELGGAGSSGGSGASGGSGGG